MAIEYKPGQVNIDDISISTHNGRQMSITDMVTLVKFTYGIYHATMFGEITINDAAGFEERMGIHGEEVLYLKLRVPALKDYTVAFEADIIGMLAKDQIPDNFYTYKLSFVSKTQRRNMEIRLQKTLKKNTPTRMVESIFNNYLKGSSDNNVFAESPVPKSITILDQSIDASPLVCPGISPIRAIRRLASKAKSEKYGTGSSYLFFENLTSFVFGSLGYLMTRDPVDRQFKVPGPQSSVTSKDITHRTMADVYHTFQSFSVRSMPRVDVSVQAGTYTGKAISHDPVRRTALTSDYNYFNQFNKQIHLNATRLVDDVDLGKSHSTNIISYPKQYGMWEFDDSDEYGPKEFLHRNAVMTQLYNGVKFNAELYGYPALFPGQILYIKMPSVGAAQDFGDNLMYTGKYIITAIEHVISRDMTQENPVPEMRSNLVLASDTYGSRA